MPSVNPFKQPGRWYRGNTHSHSTESDGRMPIADRFAQYRDGGYDFLVLTDHRKVNDVSAHSRDGFLAISGSEVHPDNPYGGDRYHIGGGTAAVGSRNRPGRAQAAEGGILPDRRQYQPEAALNGPLRRDRTFFANTIEGERESGQEFSEIPGVGVRARINAALALPIYSRAAVSSVAEGLFPTESVSTQTSFKLTHRLTDSHELMARYAFSR